MIVSLLAIVGLTLIVVDGAIMKPLKARITWPWLSYLLSCYQCTGFHVGAVVGLCIDPWHCLLYGGAGSVLAMFAAAMLRRMT